MASSSSPRTTLGSGPAAQPSQPHAAHPRPRLTASPTRIGHASVLHYYRLQAPRGPSPGWVPTPRIFSAPPPAPAPQPAQRSGRPARLITSPAEGRWATLPPFPRRYDASARPVTRLQGRDHAPPFRTMATCAAIRTKGSSKPLSRYPEFDLLDMEFVGARRRHPRLSRQGDALGSTPKGRSQPRGADPCLLIWDTTEGASCYILVILLSCSCHTSVIFLS